MIEELTYSDIKNFCQDFCEHFNINDVPKKRITVGISRKNGILVVIKGVSTKDGTLLIKFYDTEMFLSPSYAFVDDMGKSRFVFSNNKIKINKYFTDFMERKFGERYVKFCENIDIVEK